MTGKSGVSQRQSPSLPGLPSPWCRGWIWAWLGVGWLTRCRIWRASLSLWSWVRAHRLLSLCGCVLFLSWRSSLLSTVAPVPVGGDVIVEVDYLYGADSKLAGARLRCGISRGTFPHVSWLLNASVLPSETNMDSHTQPLLHNYALADSGRTLFVTSLRPEESGFYRCRARDRYDDSGPWVESKAILVQVTGDDMNFKMIFKKKVFFTGNCVNFRPIAEITLPSHHPSIFHCLGSSLRGDCF